MKYIVTLDVEVEDGNTEEDVRRAIEGVAEQAQSGWFGLTGDPKVTAQRKDGGEPLPMTECQVVVRSCTVRIKARRSASAMS
jgi:hypothetical protein